MADFRAIEELIRSRIGAHGVPSLVAGVLQGDDLWQFAGGQADVAAGRAATPDTPYSLASITKPMLGVILMRLVEEGKLELDRPANEYLGEQKLVALDGDASEATVRRIAQHTAGLPLHYQFFFYGEDGEPPSYEETIRRYGKLFTPPGNQYQYSNLGYGILGYIAERVSSRTLRSLYRSILFEPLGMANSIFQPGTAEFKDCAARYDYDRKPLPYYVTDHPAASEAFSSLEDLVRFGRAMFDGFLCPDSMEEMLQPSEVQPYGIGWRVVENELGERLISHTGGMDGVSTRLMVVPERKTVVAILCNLDSAVPVEVANEIYQAIGLPVVSTTPAALHGRWRGAIETPWVNVPFEMAIGPEGTIVVVDGQVCPARIHFKEDRAEGEIDCTLGLEGRDLANTFLVAHWQASGGRILGAATVRNRPSARIGNALTYPIRLELE